MVKATPEENTKKAEADKKQAPPKKKFTVNASGKKVPVSSTIAKPPAKSGNSTPVKSSNGKVSPGKASPGKQATSTKPANSADPAKSSTTEANKAKKP